MSVGPGIAVSAASVTIAGAALLVGELRARRGERKGDAREQRYDNADTTRATTEAWRDLVGDLQVERDQWREQALTGRAEKHQARGVLAGWQLWAGLVTQIPGVREAIEAANPALIAQYERLSSEELPLPSVHRPTPVHVPPEMTNGGKT